MGAVVRSAPARRRRSDHRRREGRACSAAAVQRNSDAGGRSDSRPGTHAVRVKLKERDLHANEFSSFFKDTWKISSNLTLNLGVKYEWYGVPYEARGLAGRVVGGLQGLCGIACGALTTVEFVGKNSPQSN